jgi:hypothetical protein
LGIYGLSFGSFMVDVSDFVVWIFRSFGVGVMGWWLEKVRSSAIDDGTPLRSLEYLGEARN